MHQKEENIIFRLRDKERLENAEVLARSSPISSNPDVNIVAKKKKKTYSKILERLSHDAF